MSLRLTHNIHTFHVSHARNAHDDRSFNCYLAVGRLSLASSFPVSVCARIKCQCCAHRHTYQPAGPTACVQVLVTCGSLLTQRLEPVDLQFECMFPFNGLAAFTQTKRHQAVLVEHYAEAHPGIHFSAVHPGWLEAQGVKEAAPRLLRRVSVRCRSVEEAADTILWLAISRAALRHSSGMFFQDRRTTCPHLPFGKTKTSLDDEKFFMRNLEDFVQRLGLS
ncbi:hypothetical protein HPB48_020211 [Haemaphysalis longicornis]|uniref:Uncharacterized protein n=1 Tax=Haemaphysalis longicornis TaxID=44386 RepID=A0A9J6FFB6_HAELO|nr:hypothetical protein HPB48_020211 [Haemaphysalis longicornis]